MTAELTPPCEGLGLDSACSPRVWKKKKKQIGHHARPRRAAATQLHMTTALSSGTSLWVLCMFRRWSFRWSIATPTAYDPTGPELCPGLSIYIYAKLGCSMVLQQPQSQAAAPLCTPLTAASYSTQAFRWYTVGSLRCTSFLVVADVEWCHRS